MTLRLTSLRFLTAASLTLSGAAFAQDAGPGADAGPDVGADAGPDIGADAGSGSGSGLDLGASCTFGTDECGEGALCTSIFQNQAGQVDEESAACYATCEAAGGACTAANGLTGTCAGNPADMGATFLCVVQSPNLGPCGNSANASCADTPLCLQSNDGSLPAGVGFCATACDLANPTTCTAIPDNGAGPDGCGCTGNRSCSGDLRLAGPGGAAGDGVCGEPTSAGDTCGFDAVSFELTVCTEGQTCQTPQGETQGRCTGGTPPAPDAGPGGDNGAADAGPAGGDNNGGGGTDEPGDDEDDSDSGCSASHVPSDAFPLSFGLVVLLGLALRRRD